MDATESTTKTAVIAESDLRIRRASRRGMVYSSIALFVSLIGFVGVAVSEYASKKALSAAEETIERLTWHVESLLSRIDQLGIPTVDLTKQGFQPAGESFSCRIDNVEPYLDGVRITGLVLNMTAVAQDNLRFSAYIPPKEPTGIGRRGEITVVRAASGRAARFTTVIPDIQAKDAKSMQIRYVGSIVNFQAQE